MSLGDLGDVSFLELFRQEAANQTQSLTEGLLLLERDPRSAGVLESCMRAAHSLKGAARIVDIEAAVRVAHVMEDCFVAAQRGQLVAEKDLIDQLLAGVDLLSRLAGLTGPDGGRREVTGPEVEELVTALAQALSGEPGEGQCGGPRPSGNGSSPVAGKTVVAPQLTAPSVPQPERVQAVAPVKPPAPPVAESPLAKAAKPVVPRRDAGSLESVALPPAVAALRENRDRVVRVTAENINQLLALSGESLVASRWLRPFAGSLMQVKRFQHSLTLELESARDALAVGDTREAFEAVSQAMAKSLSLQDSLAARLADIESYDRRSTNLSRRLYDEALACRMRPFADGVQGFPRMVRDVARNLDRDVRFEILGESTPVDRDILERLEAPLNHLLRNAIDHGLEAPDAREALGKAREGRLLLEAEHRGGMLLVTVSDDGRGVDLQALRRTIVQKKLSTEETVAHLSEAELLEFLFLPGFSLKDEVTEISGRGVGLDVVQTMVRQVRGNVRVTTKSGHGTRFQLQLPLTLSVVSALLVEVGGELYALPLAYILKTIKLARTEIQSVEGRQHFRWEGAQAGLVSAHQVLGYPGGPTGETLSVVMVGDHHATYGLVVDRFVGGRELVVQPLDPRLGKVKDLSGGALLDDGTVVLILDLEDLIRSVERLASSGTLTRLHGDQGGETRKQRKRVLVVDDSLTVRELERKLLASRGYEVEVAVNGVDGWNAVRTGRFDLVVTDVDMPRMDGIQLVGLLKQDVKLKSLPVMIVSYKDREEDRRRGLEAGADYYLAKSSFHDETLLSAVADLIGEADA